MKGTTEIKTIDENCIEVLDSKYFKESYLQEMARREYQRGIIKGQTTHVAQIESCSNCSRMQAMVIASHPKFPEKEKESKPLSDKLKFIGLIVDGGYDIKTTNNEKGSQVEVIGRNVRLQFDLDGKLIAE